MHDRARLGTGAGAAVVRETTLSEGVGAALRKLPGPLYAFLPRRRRTSRAKSIAGVMLLRLGPYMSVGVPSHRLCNASPSLGHRPQEERLGHGEEK
jgi:hypothetical protein